MRAARLATFLCLAGALSWAWSSNPPTLTRGPYLQSAQADRITLVCRTSTAAAVVLRARALPASEWELELSSPTGTEHDFLLTGLLPQRSYAYELEANGCLLAGGPGYVFRTPPAPASRLPFRFLAFGDSGTGDVPQAEVAARMQAVTPPPEMLLGLGDLVYDNGEAASYDPRLFAPYAELLRRATFWPTLGNHDNNTANGAPFFQAFRLPTGSGAPGHPSNSEHYYSFDHGMAHFVCLDSETGDTSAGSPMVQWLIDDLDDASTRGVRWLIAFMHHPPYTRGTHDSSTEAKLIRIHDDLVPLFEARGVDLVLVGHSHVYERSFLLKDDAILQDDPSDYTKIGSPDGTLYLVSGCGGRSGTGPLDHPLMAVSNGNVRGFNTFDVSWDAIHGAFTRRDGQTTDLFTVRKAPDRTPPRVAQAGAPGPGLVELTFDEPLRTGTGPGGAEDPARYTLDPPTAVLEASLSADRRTVRLRTGTLAANRGHVLEVHGVSDAAGNPCVERPTLLRAEAVGRNETVVVPRASEWRYRRGSRHPPQDWTTPDFDDGAWARGAAGFGYGDGDDATVLGDMRGNYVTLFARTTFAVADPGQIAALELRVRYDDGFVAYLNGVEIARAGVPWGQNENTLAEQATEAAAFVDFDVSAFRPWLTAGTNVLAVAGHNVALGDDDFTLQPELVLFEDGPGGPPLALARADRAVANVPARIAFSAAGSFDRDGPLSSLRWDFGDGTSAWGAEVAHVFDRPGLFPVTLEVLDGQGDQALARVPVLLHEQGLAPRASIAVDRTRLGPGEELVLSAGTSLDPDGGALAYQWDFGDPGSGVANHARQREARHVYTQPGTYSVVLRVVDDEGSEELAQVVIEVQDSAPDPGPSGGGCTVAAGDGPRPGDPSLALSVGGALLVLLLRRRPVVPQPACAGHGRGL